MGNPYYWACWSFDEWPLYLDVFVDREGTPLVKLRTGGLTPTGRALGGERNRELWRT